MSVEFRGVVPTSPGGVLAQFAPEKAQATVSGPVSLMVGGTTA